MVKESWLERNPAEDNLGSHVFGVRRRLVTMQQVVKANLERTQIKQKRLYDIHSSQRKLAVGDKALLLLPSPGSKLEMRWQVPYTVTKALEDGLNYELDTGKERKQDRTYTISTC